MSERVDGQRAQGQLLGVFTCRATVRMRTRVMNSDELSSFELVSFELVLPYQFGTVHKFRPQF
eukprot:SAG31_NODE_2530_length_5556_cov_2.442917_2_plen_63_part_00